MEYSGVSNERAEHSIRPARPDEFAQLRELEFKADKLLEAVGIGPFINDESENHLARAALVLVVNDPPVGFVCVELVGGIPHIWQLAVDPDHGRRGLGRALMNAACDWARSASGPEWRCALPSRLKPDYLYNRSNFRKSRVDHDVICERCTHFRPCQPPRAPVDIHLGGERG
jgi:GNAT superfamily N-acetyltransferase